MDMNIDDKIRQAHLAEQMEAVADAGSEAVNAVGRFMNSVGEETTVQPKDGDFTETFFGQRFGWMKSDEEFRKNPPQIDSHFDMMNPVPLVILMADPDTAYCIDCSFGAVYEASKNNLRRCDNCLVDGIKYFHEVMLSVGLFVIFGNVCEDCLEKQHLSAPESGQK